jgi:hypothetical protein
LLTVCDKKAVAKPKRDRLREERIHNEVIVDAYGPEEQALGWYYFLEDKLRFPFPARCISAKVVSPLRKGETVEVLRMAPERCVCRRHAGVDSLAGTQCRSSSVPTSCH